MTTALVLYEPPPTQELAARRAALAKLHGRLAELEREHEEAEQELRAFRLRWDPAVGHRYVELEELRRKIRRAWEELRKARAGELIDLSKSPARRPSAPVFQPAAELRKLFRELARRIHPDRAEDLDDRQRRHEFMAEATRAYRAGDHLRLQWLLEHWEASPHLARSLDANSSLLRVGRRIAWTRYRIRELNARIAALHSSSLAEIRREAERARREGRNFVQEMRQQVLRDLDAARDEARQIDRALEGVEPDAARIVRANAGWARAAAPVHSR